MPGFRGAAPDPAGGASAPPDPLAYGLAPSALGMLYTPPPSSSTTPRHIGDLLKFHPGMFRTLDSLYIWVFSVWWSPLSYVRLG